MNLFKWLKSKAGKIPLTIAQTAGITAVVGAAGFAAMSYLSSPEDNNTSFMPPSAYEQQGDVVYISQGGGGGQYASNGEIASAFHAKQSDSIRLANEKYERQQRARALEEADVQPAYATQEEGSGQLPKAYQMGASDVGLGMGSGADKQLNGALDVFSNLQKEIPGLGNAIDNAQAQASAAQQGAAAAQGAEGSNGQAAKFARASTDWSKGGTVRAGSGSGVNNSFAIQNSGKNVNSKEAAAALAQAGNAMADAQAAINGMKEGTRMRSSSRASFGRSDGLGEDKDARGQGGRARYGNAKNELEWIRKRSAEIDKNKSNAANEGGRPFLASAKISGGLTVDGEQVTTGQSSTSVDLSSADRQMRGIKAGLGSVESKFEERTKDRHNLRKWMWIALPVALAAMAAIAILVVMARYALFTAWIFYALAAALTAVALWPILKLISAGISYNQTYGMDAFSGIAVGLGALLTAGIGAAWLIPEKIASLIFKYPVLVGGLAAALGFGGATTFQFLSKKGEGIDAKDLDDNATQGDMEERAEKLKGEGK